MRSFYDGSTTTRTRVMCPTCGLPSYACPPGGIILDLFAGSCSASVAARNLGMRSVAIEARESQCEKAAKRLAQAPLQFEVSS